MTTSTINLDNTWVQVTDGIEDYVVQLADAGGDNLAKMTLNDGPVTDATPFFTLKEGQGFSQITHPGKLWAKIKRGDHCILVVSK